MSALALIPSLGGIFFVGFLAAAQFTDLKVQRDEAKGRRVLPRPWSIVSDDPRTLGHWFTLAAACIFATTVPTTSIWKGKAAGENDIALVISASIAATSFFLMALVPHRDSRSSETVTASSVWHSITAGGFLGIGSFHSIRLTFAATHPLESRSIFVLRIVLIALMGVCVLAQLFGVLYMYFITATVFNKHYYPALGTEPDLSQLSEEEDFKLRKKMMLLFVLQAIWGLAYGALIATAADEVSFLKGNDASPGGLVSGLAFAVTFIVSLASYFKFSRE